ncbi:MAG: potassium-transporting ATPase subunit KdpA [Ardenticatenaceae bacterium]|nr:potassium-transporting ATPase subunit KdpA [Ardenticatenaceae bacterium]
MTQYLQIPLYLILLLLLAWPLGRYMARVYQGQTVWWTRPFRPLEHLFYRLAGIDASSEMRWQSYALALLLFNAIGFFFVYLLQRVQGWLALNPDSMTAVSPHIALNTAVSFTSNTNWQAYGGETSLSYLTQMAGLTVQNFLSAATGMAVLVAFIRGLSRQRCQTIGNFWVDMTRSTLYILLPLSVLMALCLVSQGVVQTFRGAVTAVGLTGVSTLTTATEQTIALGPAASQIAIKQLGTNGGGFFNVNAAHPFENPTPLTNLIELLAILLIPTALCFTFGEMMKQRRQGLALLVVMLLIFIAFLGTAVYAEQSGNPRLTELGVHQLASPTQSGGNMEGKETRFGIVSSALWATATTAASNGSVNSMHDAYTPLGGLAPMLLMQLGEIIFGGVGSGLYGLLAFAIVAVFVAGLMVGRTPEYLGKKIEVFEMKMATLVILIPPLLVLLGTAVATSLTTNGTSNPGAHGFSQILYAFSSMGNNNGSAFAGLNSTLPIYALGGALAMLVARYWLIIPILAMAGSLASKQTIPTTAGTLPTDTPLFIGWLIVIILLVGALSFLPALALGPIVEQLLL